MGNAIETLMNVAGVLFWLLVDAGLIFVWISVIGAFTKHISKVLKEQSPNK